MQKAFSSLCAKCESLFALLKLRKQKMCLSIVKYYRLVIINTPDCSVQNAENNGGFVHCGSHRFAFYGERLKGYIQSGVSCREIIGAVKFSRAFNINLRKLFEFSVNKKAVFVSKSVVADSACQTK